MVYCVEGFGEVYGHCYGTVGRSGFIEGICDVMGKWEEGSCCRVISSETVLCGAKREVWSNSLLHKSLKKFRSRAEERYRAV